MAIGRLSDIDSLKIMVNERVLEVDRIVCQSTIPVRNLRVDVDASAVAEELIIRMNAFVANEQLGTSYVYFPATWWDHWKRDHAPKWFLRWFPLEMKRFEFEGKALFPNYVIPDDAKFKGGRIILREIPKIDFGELAGAEFTKTERNY